MARLPRIIIPNQPHHIIQRGNDRRPVFHDTDDYQHFLARLHDASRQYKVAIHAYVLMTNHIHLLASPSDETGLARMMQWIGRYYVPYFNRKYSRVGTLWEGRYKTTIIDSERYLMTCCRYIELNPVRGGLTASPAEYPWSSYAHHVGKKLDPIISDHPLYWSLGNTPFEREAAYQGLIEQGLTATETSVMSETTLKGWALGSEKFKKSIEKQTSRRVSPAKRGRPRKIAQAKVDVPASK